MKSIKLFSVIIGSVLMLSSCYEEFSSTTGQPYNEPKSGGFQKMPFVDQETGPGLVLVLVRIYVLDIKSIRIISCCWKKRFT